MNKLLLEVLLNELKLCRVQEKVTVPVILNYEGITVKSIFNYDLENGLHFLKGDGTLHKITREAITHFQIDDHYRSERSDFWARVEEMKDEKPLHRIDILKCEARDDGSVLVQLSLLVVDDTKKTGYSTSFGHVQFHSRNETGEWICSFDLFSSFLGFRRKVAEEVAERIKLLLLIELGE